MTTVDFIASLGSFFMLVGFTDAIYSAQFPKKGKVRVEPWLGTPPAPIPLLPMTVKKRGGLTFWKCGQYGGTIYIKK